MLKIGTLQLESNVLLAPLAGISDSSFRLLCRQFGASFTFVEMINARAISHKSKKTKKMLAYSADDKPIGIQILGAEIPYLLRAVDVIEPYGFDLLDFNAACPVRKVCRRGEGVSLMREPQKLRKILEALAARWQKPLTIKIRSGWDPSSKNAAEIAQIAQDAGVDAVFVHGRDKHQLYKGSVDYRVIADVKKSVSIPVVASGDIWSGSMAKKMFAETGCDGILVARGALGNPWVFREIEGYLKEGRLPAPPSIAEIAQTLRSHMELSIAEHGEKNGVALMRKFVGWYLKGRPQARLIRQRTSALKTKKDYVDLIDSLPSVCRSDIRP